MNSAAHIMYAIYDKSAWAHTITGLMTKLELQMYNLYQV